MTFVPVALTVAGSDSGGGAGIQADLKTFTAFRVYGASVITAVTAQNTLGVKSVHAMEPRAVADQLEAVLEDLQVDAVKTGMLATAQLIATVATLLRDNRAPLVVDPVMVAKSGHRLLAPDAVDALKSELLPLAMVVTPNRPEAEVLSGIPIDGEDALREAARRIHRLGSAHVVIKGGHASGPLAVDLHFNGREFEFLTAERLSTPNTHGTGCTFSAATAADLARGATVPAALRSAKSYLTKALRQTFPVGRGCGPVNHFVSPDPNRIERG